MEKTIMIKILKPCPSCGNRKFEISGERAKCLGEGLGNTGCGKVWTLSDELVKKLEEENV